MLNTCFNLAGNLGILMNELFSKSFAARKREIVRKKKLMIKSLTMNLKRGALVVFEGCDRAGKTTQAKLLVERLKSQKVDAKFMNFPNRLTPSGKIIDAYLRNKENLTDEGIHLLFSVNRWEAMKEMESELMSGTTIVVDRYSYSGVAYSAAKGLDFEWCKNPDKGLLKPDLVIYLTLTAEAMARRSGYGDERYDIPEFQQKVMSMFMKMEEKPLWQLVDADKTEKDLSDDLLERVSQRIQGLDQKALGKLW